MRPLNLLPIEVTYADPGHSAGSLVRAAPAPPRGVKLSHQIRSPPSPSPPVLAIPSRPRRPAVDDKPPTDDPDRASHQAAPAAGRDAIASCERPPSTGHVDQADHGALGPIPDRDHLGCRQQLHPAATALKEGSRLLRQPDPALLPGTDKQPPGPLMVDMAGLGQRDGMRGAIDGLGQLLLPLLDLAAQPDEHIVVEHLPVDGDRAELCLVDPGSMLPHYPRRLGGGMLAVRTPAHGSPSA